MTGVMMLLLLFSAVADDDDVDDADDDECMRWFKKGKSLDVNIRHRLCGGAAPAPPEYFLQR